MGTSDEHANVVQDLASFRLPPGFRGRSAVVVQLWWLVQALLFRPSPQVMYAWRRMLLRLFGARIGRGVLIRSTVRVTYPWKLAIGDHSWIGDYAELYSLAEIRIGANAVVSQYAYLCTGSHRTDTPTFDMAVAPIVVEDEAWVAAGAFVHPGLTVRHGSVLGAKSVLTCSTEACGIYVGVPAKLLRYRLRSENEIPSSLRQ